MQYPQFEEERGEAASDQGAAAPVESQDSLDEPSSGRSIENEELNHLISARGRGQQQDKDSEVSRQMESKSIRSGKLDRAAVNKEFFEK